MNLAITIEQLTDLGLPAADAKQLSAKITHCVQQHSEREQTWQALTREVLTANYPFAIHLFIFMQLFPDWHEHQENAPAWIPTDKNMKTANIQHFMQELNISDSKSLHQWTIQHSDEFWQKMLVKLNIVFAEQPEQICDLSQGVATPVWLPKSKMNIIASCFTADPHAIAITYSENDQTIKHLTYRELDELSNQIANSLVQAGYKLGDKIGIAMPMNYYAVAIYLGIIKMGGVVVSIADSFSSEEIATRLDIAKAVAIFTQDYTLWGEKKLPLYEKVRAITTLDKYATSLAEVKIIVVAGDAMAQQSISLNKNDLQWKDFLVTNKNFNYVAVDAMSACNILFSSGTTGVPKAIVWNHSTPIKAASDAYFHQNIKPGDVLAWPTNLGWMMGPWLIFAALLNHATIALYHGAPKDKAFGEFVQNAKVSMLGVVPTLVATWRQSKCMEKLNWQSIEVFSSTGECSNPEDMLYLMSLAGYKPVIEYCGGTEIGGAYISSTVIDKNYPALFSTPTMGLNIVIIDENAQPADIGEVAIIPPSLGLSTQLINADHYQVYFANMPKTANGKVLRRHGDQIKRYPNGYFAILGRVDDTMKLGGIKTSAAEIERSLAGLPNIIEVAAIAIQPPDNGPSQLVIYAATSASLDKTAVIKEMQKRINAHLNPLFKIYDVIFTKDLPKTASNKIMRRVLRKKYQEAIHK